MAVTCGVMATCPVVPAPDTPPNVTDKQGTSIEPLLPAPNTDGRSARSHPRREIVNALFFVRRPGCVWPQLPPDLPPWQTVYWYFNRRRDDGTADRVHGALRDRLRDAD